MLNSENADNHPIEGDNSLAISPNQWIVVLNDIARAPNWQVCELGVLYETCACNCVLIPRIRLA